MSTPFEIERFEAYLQPARNELPKGRKSFLGQTKLAGIGCALKPPTGRSKHLLDRSYGLFDRRLFPDLDGIAKWLRYWVFESRGPL